MNFGVDMTIGLYINLLSLSIKRQETYKPQYRAMFILIVKRMKVNFLNILKMILKIVNK